MTKARHGAKKNQKLKVLIESIAAGGQGFTRHDGLAIFVDRGVPGDYAEIELYDTRKDFAHAKILNLLEASPMRQEAQCKLFKVCGGCQWQHINYGDQLALKAEMIRQVIKHIAGLDPALVQQTLGADEPMHYRNKVQFPVASPNKSTRILAGYYKEGSHELVNIKHCPVQPDLLDNIIEFAKEAAEQSGFSAYNEETHSGLIRHFLARYSFSDREVLFTPVLNLEENRLEALLPALRQFADKMLGRFPELAGFCVNLNPKRGNRIMGDCTRLIAGRDHIIETLRSERVQAPELLRDGIKFRISAQSFFQINSRQALRLMELVYDAINQYAQKKSLKKIPLVLDAFAGVASLALWISPLADKVLAVEELEAAVLDAREIMQLNSIANVEAICARVEDFFPELVTNQCRPDVLILDPPRKGVERDALLQAAQLEAERIVYVSCNPSTLARDLKILEASSYKTISIQPLDLFPQTYHVESVSILDRA